MAGIFIQPRQLEVGQYDQHRGVYRRQRWRHLAVGGLRLLILRFDVLGFILTAGMLFPGSINRPMHGTGRNSRRVLIVAMAITGTDEQRNVLQFPAAKVLAEHQPGRTEEQQYGEGNMSDGFEQRENVVARKDSTIFSLVLTKFVRLCSKFGMGLSRNEHCLSLND